MVNERLKKHAAYLTNLLKFLVSARHTKIKLSHILMLGCGGGGSEFPTFTRVRCFRASLSLSLPLFRYGFHSLPRVFFYIGFSAFNLRATRPSSHSFWISVDAKQPMYHLSKSRYDLVQRSNSKYLAQLPVSSYSHQYCAHATATATAYFNREFRLNLNSTILNGDSGSCRIVEKI